MKFRKNFCARFIRRLIRIYIHTYTHTHTLRVERKRYGMRIQFVDVTSERQVTLAQLFNDHDG